MLCVYNFAETFSDVRDKELRGFITATPDIYLQASETEGFLGSALSEFPVTTGTFFTHDWGRWGEFHVPWNYASKTSWSIRYAVALSCWKSIESLKSFTYSNAHLAGLRNRRAWFNKTSRPSYVLWWSHVWPTWQTACQKIEELDRNGADASAFTLRTVPHSSHEDQ